MSLCPALLRALILSGALSPRPAVIAEVALAQMLPTAAAATIACARPDRMAQQAAWDAWQPDRLMDNWMQLLLAGRAVHAQAG
mmetsp:Transcript_3081/g.8558  ORF Transcript_3081/g.8558 Transcript_3081/m.8558 type:complete len:83 (+) Transcript_3081:489-737(+)